MKEFKHITVLLNEAVDALNIKADGIYVDGTLGGGGHSALIAQKLATGVLYAFDQDDTALTYNTRNLAPEIEQNKVILVKGNFRQLSEKLAIHNVSKIDGMVYDLGVSSPQFDDAQRGFSYNYDAPLDMRMDQTQPLTAKQIVNEWSFNDLMRILTRYGDEKFAKQISRSIERHRQVKTIETTFELVEIIKEAIPMGARRHGGHPAKKSFQAIRIAVNDELGALESSLEQALNLLNINGRISVITFQPLEDRIVKTMFREATSIGDVPMGLPVIPAEMLPDFKLVTRKPILPSEQELSENRRSHSAKLRVIERVK
ncbi:16S rRNA (cytosine(1402)-N(4))-methyltransferase RsmH [Periweissella beninensis]|uniref:16S rRNA (cytosine(1402)-N(4))-methyltransferase RsmH n=1 Tax=Periweissella beninensis TaxID=504936 RepID=UPI0021A91356|nr:16S rRNA (cytosine(1402)-N(4))-methyltransferase RsmH [Periweissella beninensis]MCT4396924.1 16S rRNA (cytosine(1402)-N(4))-methyltransferase RsmH [Periweissella beninensis]